MNNPNPSNSSGASQEDRASVASQSASSHEPRKLLRDWRFVAKVGLLIGLSCALAWWLTRPAKTASIAIAGQVRSLTMEVLCGEKLLWDLPPGQIRHRSAAQGAGEAQFTEATLSLSAGARVRVDMAPVGTLRLAVDQVDSIARHCGREAGSSFEVVVDGKHLPHDPAGFYYAAASVDARPDAATVSLPLKGRVMLGRPIQYGGGWKGGDGGATESIFVTRRVVPAFSDEKVTLGTDRLDDGSILDTHACFDATPDVPKRCASGELDPATGFLRASAGKGLEVQLYVRGPIGVRTYEGDRQHQVSIPNSSFAWQSESVKYWLALLVLVVSFWEKLVKPFEKKQKEALNDTAADVVRDHGTAVNKDEDVKRQDDRSAIAKALGPLVTLILASLSCPPPSWAEPVEVRQEGSIGAGYSFRRGSTCHVITANHVVRELGARVTVEDKTGARGVGDRTFTSEESDLALISLLDNSSVACTTQWPDGAWMRSATFSGSNAFRAVRHYTSGREAIVRLVHAGGDRNYFSLAPADKLNIRESDSGASVEFEGKLVGIVLSVDTATDRVKVLRFDRIDELLGERLRGAAVARIVRFLGVVQRGVENPTWTKYMEAWITEKSGRVVISATASAGQAAKANCEAKVEVLSWDHASAPNPDRNAIELQLKSCGKKGFFFEQLCKQARQSAATAPSQVISQRLTLNVLVTPKGAPTQSKLVTNTFVPPVRQAKLQRRWSYQPCRQPPARHLLSSSIAERAINGCVV